MPSLNPQPASMAVARRKAAARRAPARRRFRGGIDGRARKQLSAAARAAPGIKFTTRWIVEATRPQNAMDNDPPVRNLARILLPTLHLALQIRQACRTQSVRLGIAAELDTNGQSVSPYQAANAAGAALRGEQQQETSRQFFVFLQHKACAAVRYVGDRAAACRPLFAGQDFRPIVKLPPRFFAQFICRAKISDDNHGMPVSRTIGRHDVIHYG